MKLAKMSLQQENIKIFKIFIGLAH